VGFGRSGSYRYTIGASLTDRRGANGVEVKHFNVLKALHKVALGKARGKRGTPFICPEGAIQNRSLVLSLQKGGIYMEKGEGSACALGHFVWEGVAWNDT